MPNVYIAGPWEHRSRMPALAKLFEEADWTITHRWWESDPSGAYNDNIDRHRTCAEDDLRGVLSADVLIVLNSTYSEGKAVEQGIALISGIPICVIGDGANNIFHALPQFTKVGNAVEALLWANEEITKCQPR